MDSFWGYIGMFILSFVGLGIFYRNTLRNGLVSIYILFFAFVTYSIVCDMYFRLPQDPHLLAFYLAQAWFAFVYMRTQRKRKHQPASAPQRSPLPVSARVEEAQASIAQ
ncbi:hypothetical protein [Aneurinibacillus sp. REN35]|uniref:hypothetical protein n=1 Tax=Aneurinibacillus sp. REN35 TaxID=3237286 RepID=UPI0035275302